MKGTQTDTQVTVIGLGYHNTVCGNYAMMET